MKILNTDIQLEHYNHPDVIYLQLLQKVLSTGQTKQTRNGSTISIFGETLEFDLSKGSFPLLSSKKMPFRTIITELVWFIKGRTDLRFLLDNNCNIWNGDAYERYKRTVHEGGWDATWCEVTPYSIEEFIELFKTDDDFNEEFGDLGPIYGYQWRNSNIDQLKGAIDLIKYNPDSRRILVSAWNVSDLDGMVLPPCHYSFQFYSGFNSDGSRNLSMLVNMRSVDVPLGLPFNIASYAALLSLVAKIVGMTPLTLKFCLGDVHVYENQSKSAILQLDQFVESYNKGIMPEPVLNINSRIDKDFDIDMLEISDFAITNYNPLSPISYPLSN